ncbi:MAG: hypothetical protein AB1644_10440 [Candidatus Zixiibacteriota bacterium]
MNRMGSRIGQNYSVGARASLWLPVLTLLVFGITSAWGFPRLTVEHAESCKNCHINPTGSGARSEYGNFTTAFNELSLPWTKKLVAAHYKKPRIGDALIVGFDSRHLVLRDGSLFWMQTDGYLTVEPFKGFYYHARFTERGVTENYALLQVKDQKYSLKAGRFYPAFGLHPDDHNSYIRTRTGHPPNYYLDGLSIGAELYGTELVAEVMDRFGQGVYGAQVTRTGTFKTFGYYAGLMYRLSEKVNGSYQGVPHAKAAFAGLSYDRFTALGEFDLIGEDNSSYATYAALYGRVVYGLYAVAEYNFYDADRHLKSGVNEYIRYSIELYPLPFVQIRPSFTDYLRGEFNTRDEYFLQIHFGY